MHKITKIGLLIFLVGLLVCIRTFETSLFYDPLIAFFKMGRGEVALPDFHMAKLLLNTALRFLVTTVISLGIIWLIFKERDILRLSAVLYLVLFVVLFSVFWFLLFSSEEGSHLTLFYVRRFLIQPLFLLILLPAFYFQKKALH